MTIYTGRPPVLGIANSIANGYPLNPNAMSNAVLNGGTNGPYGLLTGMIYMRLHLAMHERPFQFLECYRDNSERVHVFIVQDDRPVTLIDEWGLFPSDMLITQLRLLIGAK